MNCIKGPKSHADLSCLAQPCETDETASLIRVRPERNEWRFYRMEVWPDLFGCAVLMRQWGRIGTEGHRRLDSHPDPRTAQDALMRLAARKRRSGYLDRAT